jgi:hypothetical protein
MYEAKQRGRARVELFDPTLVPQVEPGSKGKLKKGRAWVQFCVTQGEETLILSKSGWVKVKRGAPQP